MSSTCVDQSFGVQPRDAQLSNLKVNGIAALNKAVDCKLNAVDATITKLKAKVANITTLVTTTNTVEDGVFTVNDCGAPQTWTVTGTIKKLNGIVYLNLIFTRNAPNILAPCNPIGSISAGFTPPFDITVSAPVTISGVPSPSSITILANGNIDAAFTPTVNPGDYINLVTSYAV